MTTAYNEFALETYELDVLDYLVKPIEFPRFMKAINKVDKRLNSINGKHTIEN
jgi:two-component SAPR family response regulator